MSRFRGNDIKCNIVFKTSRDHLQIYGLSRLSISFLKTSVLKSSSCMGSDRSGSHFEWVNSLSIQATPQDIRPEGLLLCKLLV